MPTDTRAARPSSTPTQPRPTNTPVPLPPTRTRLPTATDRPTRTQFLPHATPTRVPTPVGGPAGALYASCSLRRNIDFVTITMAVANRSGVDVQGLVASPLSLEPEGGALFFDRTGPSPQSVSIARNTATTTFQWTGRLSPGGTMGFSASASGSSMLGPLTTGLVDCGVAGSDLGNFDRRRSPAPVSLQPGDPGTLKVEVQRLARDPEEVEAGLSPHVHRHGGADRDARSGST